MRMILSGKMIVRCDNCGVQYDIELDSLEEETFSYDRNMGDEIEHDFIGEYTCKKCKNKLSFCTKVFEYPVGALDHLDSESSGCEFVETPVASIEYNKSDFTPIDERRCDSLLNTILTNCNNRYVHRKFEQCSDCTYGKYCPHDCEKCLDYIHNPRHAQADAPDRKYDCIHMADFYTCKYSCRYSSEIMYALERCNDLRNAQELKVLSFGCGPCTDLFALDELRRNNILSFNKIEYRGVDYSQNVWSLIHRDIGSFQNENYDIKFYYQDACDLIHTISSGSWTPDLIVFQYVFSDMQKHTDRVAINGFIDTFAEFYNTKVLPKSYIILNDINLGCEYMGGRDFFDILKSKLRNIDYHKGRFCNDHSKSSYYPRGYPYGEDSDGEFPENANRFDLTSWRAYSPFDTCASAQMIIKKVVKE